MFRYLRNLRLSRTSLLAALLLSVLPALSQGPSVKQQIQDHQRALTDARSKNDLHHQALELDSLGHLYHQDQQLQRALDAFNRALPLWRQFNDLKSVGDTLTDIGLVYGDMERYSKAASYLRQAIPVAHSAGDRAEEATALCNLGDAENQIDQNQQALSHYKAALQLQRDLHDRAGQAQSLVGIGSVYDFFGKKQLAIQNFQQALQAAREVHDREREDSVLTSMGSTYDDLGEKQRALGLYHQALTIELAIEDKDGEATTLHNMAGLYIDLGENQSALDDYGRALKLERQIHDRAGEGSTLEAMGGVYYDVGRMQDALEYLGKGLIIAREVEDRDGEADTLNKLGLTYSHLGQLQTAIDDCTQALAIYHQIGDRNGEATELHNLAQFYDDLGQPQKAIDFYSKALPIEVEIGDRNGQATTLQNMGVSFTTLGQLQPALDYSQRALVIEREVSDLPDESSTLNNLAILYFRQGQKPKALEFYRQALGIDRKSSNRASEANTLRNIGNLLQSEGDPSALDYLMAALASSGELRDPALEGGIQADLMAYFRDQNTATAILFGTAAVNSYQQIRKNITGLSKELQAGFTQSKSSTYRQLAELLVQAGRLGEAEQVLDLLKEQELKEIVRGGDDAAAKMEPLKMSAAEQKAWGELDVPEKMASSLTPFTEEQSALLAKSSLAPEDEARLKTLNASIGQQTAAISAYLKDTIAPQLQQSEAAGPAVDEEGTQSYLQNTLATLGPDVVGIRILFGDQHAYAIVVTAHTRRRFELQATPAALRSQVLQVRDDLRSPDSDPRPDLQALYAMVMGPLQAELTPLEQAAAPSGHVPTLLWSLDGVLRYVPMAALYDGHRYMVERFNNVLFTPNSYGQMSAPSPMNATGLNVLAMGLSKSYAGMPALPGVMQELDDVVHDPAMPGSHGPMQGTLLPDDRFTLASLKSQLDGRQGFPVVHIASHYGVDGSDTGEPFLLLGGETTGTDAGYKLTLSTLESSSISFHNTQLLTLSACSTAKDYRTRNGVEMDSLGMVAQQKQAAAVLASLWNVNDASTSLLMSDFYRRWATTPGLEKIEALRQAQIAMFHGELQPASGTYDLSHPYYWAPFVLIGNFR